MGAVRCQTLAVLGSVSPASVSSSAQWVKARTAKPLPAVNSSVPGSGSAPPPPLPRYPLPPPPWLLGSPRHLRARSGVPEEASSRAGRPGAPAAGFGPSLRAHKAPGADVRAPLGTAGPQCRRSRAALPPRPRSQQRAASRRPSSAAARPEPGPRTCPPDLQTCAAGSARPRGARAPPASLQPWKPPGWPLECFFQLAGASGSACAFAPNDVSVVAAVTGRPLPRLL
ncbi:neuronal membrane glycoprotein M6-b isoform X6 [Panthera pardus]|uniref:Neuronal membrane glycoprotein M6-b isoform X6 n=1 Tax=Panthera pardus TaxID=9691 RepID=A0A9W2UMT7_PANPR|nr:neuronal membrane glycoprotein M6-b isoform X6 [Panthera pardus]